MVPGVVRGDDGSVAGVRDRLRATVDRGARIPEPRHAAPPPAVPGLRPRVAKDLGACARLAQVVASEGHFPMYDAHERVAWLQRGGVHAWLQGPGLVDAWVVERAGELLGHVAVSRIDVHSHSAYRWREITGIEPDQMLRVSRFFVRERVRGRGIGSALLGVAVERIRAGGMLPVAEVVSESAMRLHYDLGWRPRGRYPTGERPMHYLVMMPE